MASLWRTASLRQPSVPRRRLDARRTNSQPQPSRNCSTHLLRVATALRLGVASRRARPHAHPTRLSVWKGAGNEWMTGCLFGLLLFGLFLCLFLCCSWTDTHAHFQWPRSEWTSQQQSGALREAGCGCSPSVCGVGSSGDGGGRRTSARLPRCRRRCSSGIPSASVNQWTPKWMMTAMRGPLRSLPTLCQRRASDKENDKGRATTRERRQRQPLSPPSPTSPADRSTTTQPTPHRPQAHGQIGTHSQQEWRGRIGDMAAPFGELQSAPLLCAAGHGRPQAARCWTTAAARMASLCSQRADPPPPPFAAAAPLHSPRRSHCLQRQ